MQELNVDNVPGTCSLNTMGEYVMTRPIRIEYERAVCHLVALKRMITMTQPVQTVTHYGYDTHDNLTSVTDPKGNTTQYQYDDFGRRIKVISPDTRTTIYSHDEAGNISQKSDARGTVVSYTYDSLNRVTAVQFTDPTQNITYSYDSTQVTNGKGRLTGRTDSSGTYTFYYDAQGNVNREDKTVSGVLYTTQYTYNRDNALTSLTYPSERTITYTLDQTGRITQVNTTLNGNPKTLASSISYLPYGDITGLTYGNGLSLSHGYDNQYRTSSIVIGSIMSRTYDYDPNGNITSILDAIEPPGNETFESAGTYTYDTGTNILADIQGEASVVYDYDQDGNTISANSRTFVYDLSNRLITIQDNGVTIAQYVYNAFNQRVKKTASGGTTLFHYDLQGHLIAETNATGAMLGEYIYLGGQLLAKVRPGEVAYYYHNDHLETAQILTDDTGTISWKAFYKPFGEAVISVETVGNPFRFPGQYYDKETGLHYNWNRYYDPKTGRYLTPDPIGLGGGINLFVYTEGNPVNLTDPLGLYNRDVHFDLTRLLSIEAGFRSCAADIIAGADQGVDDDPATTSSCYRPNEECARRRRLWHFAAPARIDQLKNRALKDCDFRDLGIALHTLQDSFSHSGYGPIWGHFPDPRPDDPKSDWLKYFAMSRASSDLLNEFEKRCGPGCCQ